MSRVCVNPTLDSRLQHLNKDYSRACLSWNSGLQSPTLDYSGLQSTNSGLLWTPEYKLFFTLELEFNSGLIQTPEHNFLPTLVSRVQVWNILESKNYIWITNLNTYKSIRIQARVLLNLNKKSLKSESILNNLLKLTYQTLNSVQLSLRLISWNVYLAWLVRHLYVSIIKILTFSFQTFYLRQMSSQ